MAPMATIDVRYDRVCVRGGEGVVPVQRVLDESALPDVIVLPFNFGPVNGPTADAWGPPPLPLLEAAVLGIPVVVPAGDDGALGYRVPDATKPGVAYPCVLSVVICAGGTQLGLRVGHWDEGPWNDGLSAGGGGISWDPRPPWQDPPERYEFSQAFSAADHRMVPDVSADAAGHLEIFWHNYGVGGVGGTSESAAIVGAQIATINAAVAKDKRITSAGDLYVLAKAHPDAFRHVAADNDRGYTDNTLHPQPLPPPLGYHGILPSPPPQVMGCGPAVQSHGCDVRTEGTYNAVTGIGSIKESAAINDLK
jgi:subtilase family serine protease